MFGGWLSLRLLFVLAAMTLYTGFLIKKCMDSNPDISTYADIGQHAFGYKGRLTVLLLTNLELYLIVTSLLILAGDSLHSLFPHFKLKIHGIIAMGGRHTFILLIAFLLSPTVVCIDDVSSLSYLSAIGVFASVVIFGSILWSGVFDGIGFHQRGQLFHWRRLPISLGLYVLCFGGHPVFPTLYTSMRKPRHFSLVLLLCFLVCAMTCGALATIGYLMFGSELQSQITLNLPRDKLSSKVATYTALISPLSKYALVLKPIIDTIETRFQPLGRRRCYRMLTRSILVGSSTVVALSIPFYGSLMSLVGAFANVEVVSVAVAGLVILVVGTYTSLVDIIRQL